MSDSGRFPAPALRGRSLGLTHIGRRSRNEDSFRTRDDLGLWVVADGLGGMGGGDLASALVVHRIVADHEAAPRVSSPWLEDPALRMRAAIARAHEEVLAQQGEERATMASTVAALRVERGLAVVAHVGDSRVYRLRAGELVQLTEDHGAGSPHVVSRAVGVLGSGHPDVHSEPVGLDDVYLLCSDGLSSVVGAEALCRVLQEEPLERAPGRLVSLALEAGGRDNVTAVVVALQAVSID